MNNNNEYIGYLGGWICTANKDGTIPLNSRAIFKIVAGDDQSEKYVSRLVFSYNACVTVPVKALEYGLVEKLLRLAHAVVDQGSTNRQEAILVVAARELLREAGEQV